MRLIFIPLVYSTFNTADFAVHKSWKPKINSHKIKIEQCETWKKVTQRLTILSVKSPTDYLFGFHFNHPCFCLTIRDSLPCSTSAWQRPVLAKETVVQGWRKTDLFMSWRIWFDWICWAELHSVGWMDWCNTSVWWPV